ncbi:amino acid permease/ SLC12A domain-containing protein [Kalaharituber pfeilii]|nr:amino acid permease/ SLC12A domain-containing protein [Kalaharituber pfeilii]
MGVTPESFKRRPPVDVANNLNQTLRPRHLNMIAIGGSIGAGLFVGSGSALSKGGPAALLIDFAIIGFMLFNVVYALGELAIMYPVSGGFYTYSSRFISPAWGFAMGWNYTFQWLIVLPLELTVAGITVDYWRGRINTDVAVWITVFFFAILIINIFGVLGYGEEEFWSSVLKLFTIVMFMFIGLVLVCGGGPASGEYNEYIGGRYWSNPGAFSNGFKGVCAVFVTAAFAFSGTELVGLAAAESADPRAALPRAVRQVFWRITLFYILSLLFVGLLVPYNDKGLIGNGTYIDTKASPFVIALTRAGISGLPHFVNVVILISVLSIGNSSVYGGSRTLTALAEQGYAPKIFSYIDRAGRPLFSTIVTILFGLLAYINLSSDGVEIFDWLLALSGLAALFTWGSICLAHIRFRQAWVKQGHSVEEIPFRAALGVTGSWIGVIMVILVLIAQFYIAVWPLGGAAPTAEGFFKSYLALPVVLVFFAGGYFWKNAGIIKLENIDLDTGRRCWDTAEDIERRKQELAARSTWRKIFELIC